MRKRKQRSVSRTRQQLWDARVQNTGVNVNPKNVLLICDSDNAYSSDLADYYINARGLKATNKLTYSLGDSGSTCAGTDGIDMATFYTNVMTPVWAHIQANNIEAVICSFTPYYVKALPADADAFERTIATSGTLAASGWYVGDQGVAPKTGAPGTIRSITPCCVITSRNTSGLATLGHIFAKEVWNNGTLYDHTQVTAVYGVRANKMILNFGALGNPRNRDAAGYAEAKRMIDDALSNNGGTTHIGMHDRVIDNSSMGISLTGYQGERSRQYCEHWGVDMQHHKNTYNANWPEQPPTEDYSYTDMMAGTLDLSLFGFCGSSPANTSYADLMSGMAQSFTFKKGAWGYNATSNGQNLMRMILDSGGCAAVGALAEPGAGTVPHQDAFMKRLLLGDSMMMAAHLGRTTGAWVMDCWGDPMYTPF